MIQLYGFGFHGLDFCTFKTDEVCFATFLGHPLISVSEPSLFYIKLKLYSLPSSHM